VSGGQTSTGRRFSLIASVFGILALGRFLSFQPRSYAWRIAWLNMIGSNLFMISVLASYVLPSTGDEAEWFWVDDCLWLSESARAPTGLPTDACHVRGWAAYDQCCDLGEEASGGVAGNSLLHAVIDLAVGGHWAEHAHQEKLGSCVGFPGSEFEVGVE